MQSKGFLVGRGNAFIFALLFELRVAAASDGPEAWHPSLQTQSI
jgi:hypothetical protein